MEWKDYSLFEKILCVVGLIVASSIALAFIYGAGVFIVELVSELFDDYGVWAFIASIISTIILGTAVFLGQQDW